MDTDTLIIIGAIAAVVIVLAIVAAIIARPKLQQRQRSKRLSSKFGSEYERTVEASDDQEAAERDLERREEQRQSIEIRDLDPSARQRYADAWRQCQKRFVDEPTEAVRDADQLVNTVMRDRGYPVDDFERRAEDVSVDHPEVVDNYRAARRIAVANERGEAATEEVRQALVHYRELFARLLDDGGGEAADDKQDRQETR